MQPKVRTVTAVLALALALVPGLAACAHALRQTPPLEQVTGGARGHTPSDVERLLAQAEEQFASREPSAAHRAAETFSIAAAADPSRIEGLIGSIRARVWITEHDTDAAARQEAAARSVQAGQWCAKIAPE